MEEVVIGNLEEFLEYLDGNGLVITDYELISDALNKIGVSLNACIKTYHPEEVTSGN